MAAQGSAPREDTEEWVIEMLRMRRASPHGRWIENNAERNAFGRKEADSFRPDTASRDAPRFGNALDAFPFAGRSPDSSVKGPCSDPTLGRLPSHPLRQRTVAFGATRTDLPLRGQCRDGWGIDPPAHRLPVSPGAPGNGAPDTCELDYIHTGGSAAGLADLL